MCIMFLLGNKMIESGPPPTNLDRGKSPGEGPHYASHYARGMPLWNGGLQHLSTTRGCSLPSAFTGARVRTLQRGERVSTVEHLKDCRDDENQRRIVVENCYWTVDCIDQQKPCCPQERVEASLLPDKKK